MRGELCKHVTSLSGLRSFSQSEEQNACHTCKSVIRMGSAQISVRSLKVISNDLTIDERLHHSFMQDDDSCGFGLGFRVYAHGSCAWVSCDLA